MWRIASDPAGKRELERAQADYTDGVLDGCDIAPLPALATWEKYNCIMMVDDAHSSGVLGRNGRGTVDHLIVMGACISRWARSARRLARWADMFAGRAI